MATLVADIADGKHGLGAQGALHSDAVLVAGGQFIVVNIQAGDIGRIDGPSRSRTRGKGQAGIGHLDAVQVNLQAKRNVGAGVVHVVALDALVHDAEAAADDGLAGAREVIGKAEARTESGPVVIDKTLGNAVLAGDADAVGVKEDTSARENGVRAGGEARASGSATRIGRAAADRVVGVKFGSESRLIQVGIEVAHAVVGFVGVRNAVPT